jgi:hypothetical protein
MLESATIFAQQAKKAGVTVNVNNGPPDTYFTSKYLKWAFGQTNWPAIPIPTWINESLTSKAFYNETHWKRPSFDKLVLKAQAEQNEAKAKELWHEVQKVLYDQGGYLIWGFAPFLDGVSKKVHGVVPSGFFALGNFVRQYGRQPYTQYVLMPPDYSSLDTITVSGLVQDIVRPDWPAVHALVAHVFAPPAAAAPPAVPATGSAHIAVENGTTIGGLASQAATYLTSLGYTVDPAGNAGNTAYAATLVTVYNPEKQGVADMVAELFGGQVQTAPAGTSHGTDDIVVTLGQDHGTFEGF